MLNLVEGYTEEMTSLRRSIHAKPETGWTEFRTTAVIVEHLKALGYHVCQGLEVINPEFVMGRDEEEVKAAQKRAHAEGVSQEELAAMQGYTGALAVLDTAAPVRSRHCASISMRSVFRKPRIRITSRIAKDLPPNTRA